MYIQSINTKYMNKFREWNARTTCGRRNEKLIGENRKVRRIARNFYRGIIVVISITTLSSIVPVFV
ncbi:hypothetical protein RSAG8_05962, partial [Rhizoctonia solani AG-8 WAC10335]